MEQDGCFVIWRDVPGYIYHIRRGRDCFAISILCTYIATVPGKHTSVSLETSSCHSVCTHYVATSTMLNLLWLCNVTKYLPIYFTANSVSALKDSICIFECELTCVYQRAPARKGARLPLVILYKLPQCSLDRRKRKQQIAPPLPPPPGDVSCLTFFLQQKQLAALIYPFVT